MYPVRRSVLIVVVYLFAVGVVDVTADYRAQYGYYALVGVAVLALLGAAVLVWYARTHAGGYTIVSKTEE